MLVSRLVGFDTNGRAIAAGFKASVYKAPLQKVMMLPSEHLDFIDYNVVGKTEEQILSDLEKVV